jgi:hypothetical protein
VAILDDVGDGRHEIEQRQHRDQPADWDRMGEKGRRNQRGPEAGDAEHQIGRDDDELRNDDRFPGEGKFHRAALPKSVSFRAWKEYTSEDGGAAARFVTVSSNDGKHLHMLVRRYGGNTAVEKL